jgi:hypothetical protein
MSRPGSWCRPGSPCSPRRWSCRRSPHRRRARSSRCSVGRFRRRRRSPRRQRRSAAARRRRRRVPVGVDRHAPAPSQVPLKPQGGAAAQPPCGSIAPAGTGLQRPRCRPRCRTCRSRSSPTSSRRRRRSCRCRTRRRRADLAEALLPARAAVADRARSAVAVAGAGRAAGGAVAVVGRHDCIVAGLQRARRRRSCAPASRSSRRSGRWRRALGARRVELAAAGAVADAVRSRS